MNSTSGLQFRPTANQLRRVADMPWRGDEDAWLTAFADAVFDVSHRLRRYLRARGQYRGIHARLDGTHAAERLAQGTLIPGLGEQFLIEIVDGLELEVHEQRLRITTLEPEQREAELENLRSLGDELVAALESFQRTPALKGPHGARRQRQLHHAETRV